MSRLNNLFKQKKKGILNVYCTAGYPHLNSTLEIMEALQESGADIIELGIPYSDPLADGPVIQASGSRALENGMSIAVLIEQLKDMRQSITIPVVLMGYMNPVLQYGFERFCRDVTAAGVDGLILPDLPLYEFEQEYARIVKEYELDFIFLITPETSADRIRQLDNASTGFIYAVSSSSTTGGDLSVQANTNYFQRLEKMQLRNPVLIGFGIKDKNSFDTACAYASGAIIGSAYIRELDRSKSPREATRAFIASVKGT